MVINNVRLWDPSKNEFTLTNVLINQNGDRVSVSPTQEQINHDTEIFDANGKLSFFPGLFDSHVHGFGGFDFAQISHHKNSLDKILAALGESGLSYVMPTFVSLPLPTLIDSLKVINAYVEMQNVKSVPGSAQILGIHLEGPFISKECKGAHDESVLQDSISLEIFQNIIQHAPFVKEWKITISPEIKGAMQFIKDVQSLKEKGISVKVFIGHSNPEPQNIAQAFEHGACGITHLGNACLEKCSRVNAALSKYEPTSELVKWALNHSHQCPNGIELITDGIHLSEHFVKLISENLKDKIVLVSDALGPSGLADGEYTLGGVDIVKQNNAFYLAEPQKDGRKKLAGSAAPFAHCIKTYWCWMQGQSIYCAAIDNPRKSALSSNAIDNLPDHQNGALFDEQGELVLSLCQGHLYQQKPKILQQYAIEPPNKRKIRFGC